MADLAELEFTLPDQKGWADIKRLCKLKKAQINALESTLAEAADRCEELKKKSDLPDKDIKSALKSLDKAFERLTLQLGRKDIQDALAAIENGGAIGFLLSSSAIKQLEGIKDPAVSTLELNRLINQKRHLGQAVLHSELDRLCLADRQRLLHHSMMDGMSLAIEHLRAPITSWLMQAKQNKGGRQPKSDREWVIFLLARDAELIIDDQPSNNVRSKFFNLCTVVLNACKFDEVGYEEAVDRCLEKYNEWLAWSRLSPLTAPGQD